MHIPTLWELSGQIKKIVIYKTFFETVFMQKSLCLRTELIYLQICSNWLLYIYIFIYLKISHFCKRNDNFCKHIERFCRNFFMWDFEILLKQRLILFIKLESGGNLTNADLNCFRTMCIRNQTLCAGYPASPSPFSTWKR